MLEKNMFVEVSEGKFDAIKNVLKFDWVKVKITRKISNTTFVIQFENGDEKYKNLYLDGVMRNCKLIES